MVRWFEISLLFFLLGLPVFAQQGDDMRDDSIQHMASQNRRLLLDKFYAARLDSVSLILDSIDRHHCDQPLLWTSERLLLYYWIERYHAMDSLVWHFDDFSEKVAANPPPEQMFGMYFRTILRKMSIRLLLGLTRPDVVIKYSIFVYIY